MKFLLLFGVCGLFCSLMLAQKGLEEDVKSTPIAVALEAQQQSDTREIADETQ